MSLLSIGKDPLKMIVLKCERREHLVLRGTCKELHTLISEMNLAPDPERLRNKIFIRLCVSEDVPVWKPARPRIRFSNLINILGTILYWGLYERSSRSRLILNLIKWQQNLASHGLYRSFRCSVFHDKKLFKACISGIGQTVLCVNRNSNDYPKLWILGVKTTFGLKIVGIALDILCTMIPSQLVKIPSVIKPTGKAATEKAVGKYKSIRHLQRFNNFNHYFTKVAFGIALLAFNVFASELLRRTNSRLFSIPWELNPSPVEYLRNQRPVSDICVLNRNPFGQPSGRYSDFPNNYQVFQGDSSWTVKHSPSDLYASEQWMNTAIVVTPVLMILVDVIECVVSLFFKKRAV